MTFLNLQLTEFESNTGRAESFTKVVIFSVSVMFP